MYDYEIKPNFKKILNKLAKKNKETCEQILEKIKEIINSNNIEHYKNLRYNMKKFKRVHIGSFVLAFKFDKSKNLISFEDYDHHDKMYK